MLKHPNVVTLYAILSNPKFPTIVLEYVPGGSLKKKLQEIRKDKRKVHAQKSLFV